MNEITLHRKGWRKSWVFEEKEGEEHPFWHTTKRGNTYAIFIHTKYHSGHDRIWIAMFVKGQGWVERTKQIHADHFVLGNVTITF